MKRQIVHAILIATAVVIATPSFTPAVADEVVQPSLFTQMWQGLNPMNWRMPDFRSMLPRSEEKARIRKKKDGFVDEVSKTASNSWMRTKDALNPQRLNPTRFFTASARTPEKQSVKKETKPGFFRSLFLPPPEKAEPSTVNDWMKQPRPTP